MIVVLSPTNPQTGPADCVQPVVSVIHPQDKLTIYEVAQLLRQALLGYGFSEASVQDVIPDE